MTLSTREIRRTVVCVCVCVCVTDDKELQNAKA
jgi:hypothetical protein